MPRTKAVVPANRLLATLPAKSLEPFLASCVTVDLAFGGAIAVPGAPIRYVYFPTDGFISVIAPIDGLAGLEVGMVGREGMYGIDLLLGADAWTMHALVQGGGSALRMTAEHFRRAIKDTPALERTLRRYIHVLITQLAQTAACTRFHVVEARLARWLLMTRDRAGADRFALTQEFLSHMLGVRRAGVSEAATSLQRRNLIRYQRGIITILDGSAVEAVACTCYRTDKNTYDRMMH